jgi:hypothetical protein
MKYGLIFILVVSTSCAFGQESGNVIYQSSGPGVAIAGAAFGKGFATPVQGSPYSATITNESVQTLADGNRIVQTSTGTTARDSQGRTRQDTVLPAIGNLSAANAPHLVFIVDSVAQASYTLNLNDKTAQKMPMLPPGAGGLSVSTSFNGPTIRTESGSAVSTSIAGPLATSGPMPPQAIAFQKVISAESEAQVSTEDLGSQTMEGVIVNGVRTTRTIPAGEIGNDKAITIVTEVWTSPDLKTIVYSKRSDPRMGEQTFQLTNIVRAEPDAAWFRVPADFRIIDGPQPVMYHLQQ